MGGKLYYQTINMRTIIINIILLITPMLLASYFFWDVEYINTRKSMAQNRRLSINNRTVLSKKHAYFKQGFLYDKTDNQGVVAYNMNLLEGQYDIPYCWGGDIRNFSQGIDCSGFIHGLMYYSGEVGYKKRYNTATLSSMLKRNNSYLNIYSAKHTNISFDVINLQVGDIIVWPSGVSDGRNIPGNIMGHVGIVSRIINNEPYVTHYVDAPKYNDFDIIGKTGNGINTMKACDFIAFKERGCLNVFRKK